MTKKLLIGLVFLLFAGLASIKKESVAKGTSLSLGPVRTFWWVDRNGVEEAIQAPPAAYYFPDISPDGTKLVVTAELNGNRDICIIDLADGTAGRLTSYEGSDNQPIWSPDGKSIAYVSGSAAEITNRQGIAQILLKSLEPGGGTKYLSSSLGEWIFPQCWRNDGKAILTILAGPRFENIDIGIIYVDGDFPERLLLKERYNEVQPQLSPDGRWLAYCSNESGKNQIYVRPFPDVDAGKWRISTKGGNSPRWSPDGSELFYLIGDKTTKALMSVKIKTEPTFSAEESEVLFSKKYLGPLPENGIPYDVHPDGKRFLMMKE